MKIAQVRELTDKDLAERLAASRVELNRMVINHSVSPMDTPSKIKEKRREIARMMTEQHSRALKK